MSFTFLHMQANDPELPRQRCTRLLKLSAAKDARMVAV
ncbi:hypothetical protein SNOG_06812 [Parastagonospora nodorum SN15]|uniref:Uncharacterized protein n=1 Tax=Phaeosphaeria nodorum (strain SN15 / ATCC MYA-4574 / FGSC 10173) TaxID=321614 RepID=Q0UN52_PHANO|nr:hypothetical protein SNOG_06812 [Parastagonospora nodorum SN15]EAT85463.1 hypothetical protein SNOG_06812 [Parastagonospora nodorum SN15]